MSGSLQAPSLRTQLEELCLLSLLLLLPPVWSGCSCHGTTDLYPDHSIIATSIREAQIPGRKLGQWETERRKPQLTCLTVPQPE